MNKDRFLLQLEQLLYDIPKEERDEAMEYYRCYFEDAGAENEAIVLEELESPQSIADSIKEALNSTGNMTGGLKNPPQVRDSQSQSGKYEYGRGAAQNRGYKSIFSGGDFQKKEEQQDADGAEQTSGSADGQDFRRASYRRFDQYRGGNRQSSGASDRWSKVILFIILAVFTSPIWGAALSGVLGVLGVMIAAVVVLGIFSVGGVIGGIVCTVAAVVSLCTLSVIRGLLMLGTGMLLIAGSGISVILLMLICGKFLPWAMRQMTRMFGRILQWGRRTA